MSRIHLSITYAPGGGVVHKLCGITIQDNEPIWIKIGEYIHSLRDGVVKVEIVDIETGIEKAGLI